MEENKHCKQVVDGMREAFRLMSRGARTRTWGPGSLFEAYLQDIQH